MAFICDVDHEHNGLNCFVAREVLARASSPFLKFDDVAYQRGFRDGWEAARRNVASEGL